MLRGAKTSSQRWQFWLLTWFGCGLTPKAPGTAGTLGTIPLAWALAVYAPWPARVAVATLMTIIACWLSGIDQRGGAKKDPQYIVIDETAGLLWTCAWMGGFRLVEGAEPNWIAMHGLVELTAAFVLFRIFDVLKPWPANMFDRGSKTAASPWVRGANIVLDDVIAGLYGAWVLWMLKGTLAHWAGLLAR